MSKQRYLITSSNEVTWKFDRPVLFLNHSCLNYKRKHVWSKMDMKIAKPYGITTSNILRDLSKSIKKLEEVLLKILTDKLNCYHNLEFSQRYWKIILGNWLRRYIAVILKRLKSLEQCIELNMISGSTVCEDQNYSLSTIDSETAIWSFIDEKWNLVLDYYLLNLISDDKLNLEVIVNHDPQDYFQFRLKIEK